VSKTFLIVGVAAFVKIVHVELADEGAEVVVLEVFGQHILRKFI